MHDLESSEPPPLTSTKSFVNIGSGFFSLSQVDASRPTRFYLRYGHRIVTIWPYWICMGILLYHGYLYNIYIAPIQPSDCLIRMHWFSWWLTLVSYLVAHLKDPGVLPWTWAMTRRSSYTSAEIREGLATRTDQFQWVQNHVRPARAIFSKQSGHFILRGDHNCWWLGNWVGIGNHKYFFCAVLWGSCLAAVSVYQFVSIWWCRKDDIHCSMSTFYLWFFVVGLLGSVNGMQTLQQAILVERNVTVFELLSKQELLWNKHRRWNNGHVRNFEEVCGSKWFFLCWPFPVPIPRVEKGLGYGHVLEEDLGNDPFLAEREPSSSSWSFYTDSSDTETRHGEESSSSAPKFPITT